MEYKLFEEFITLQALLKELGIKIRIGDTIDIPKMKLHISIVQPSIDEQEEYKQENLEKERVAKLVKEMNKKVKTKKTNQSQNKTAPRFPGR